MSVKGTLCKVGVLAMRVRIKRRIRLAGCPVDPNISTHDLIVLARFVLRRP